MPIYQWRENTIKIQLSCGLQERENNAQHLIDQEDRF